LQKYFVIVVQKEDGERPVELALTLVRRCLFFVTNNDVIGVDEH
jgi:hypothetical protein